MKIKTKLYYEEDEGEFYWVRQSPIDPTFLWILLLFAVVIMLSKKMAS